MRKYIKTLKEFNLLNEEFNIEDSEKPSRKNLELYMQKCFFNNYLSALDSNENMIEIKFKELLKNFSIKIDLTSSAANGELKPQSIYTTNSFLLADGKTLNEKPIALAYIVQILKKNKNNKKGIQDKLNDLLTNQFQEPPETMIDIGRSNV